MTLYGFTDIEPLGVSQNLMAWARCLIWCKANDAEMLEPRWGNLLKNPHLYVHSDAHRFKQPFRTPSFWAARRRDLIVATTPCLYSAYGDFQTEIYEGEHSNETRWGDRNILFRFTNSHKKNARYHFQEIFRHSAVIREELEKAIRPEFFPKQLESRFIAIDFGLFDGFPVVYPRGYQHAPDGAKAGWFVNMIRSIRSDLGSKIPVYVFSHYPYEVIRDMVELDDVTLVASRHPVTNLLALSRASLLVTSGSSLGFWAGFIGQVPSIFSPGSRIIPYLNDPSTELELGNEDCLPNAFLTRLDLNARGSENMRKT